MIFTLFTNYDLSSIIATRDRSRLINARKSVPIVGCDDPHRASTIIGTNVTATTTAMDRLVSGDLSIDPRPASSDGSIVLDWRGRSTDRQPGRAILPFVTPCLERALHLKVPLRMHFEHLEHMNSSTITAVIQIIQEARARGTQLVLVYSPKKRWQKLGFEALRVFVKDDGLLDLTTALAENEVSPP